MLCEDLTHATEQLNMLTEAAKKHSGLLQSAQEELTRKEALIQELQHQVRGRRRCRAGWGLRRRVAWRLRAPPPLILHIQKGVLTGHLGRRAAAPWALSDLAAPVASDLLGSLPARPPPLTRASRF